MELRIAMLGSESPQQNSTKSLLTTVNSGYDTYRNHPQHNDKPVINTEIIHIHSNEDSIIDSIDTGFDKLHIIKKDCPESKSFITLYRENYLSEFRSETEKQKARDNLGVYGKNEVSKIISDVINNGTLDFITKKEAQEMIQDLDYVNSDSRSYVNYEIPDNLFKL